MSTYRNSDVATLKRVADVLTSRGFSVAPIVIPESVWTGGVPYFNTNAPMRDLAQAAAEVYYASWQRGEGAL